MRSTLAIFLSVLISFICVRLFYYLTTTYDFVPPSMSPMGFQLTLMMPLAIICASIFFRKLPQKQYLRNTFITGFCSYLIWLGLLLRYDYDYSRRFNMANSFWEYIWQGDKSVGLSLPFYFFLSPEFLVAVGLSAVIAFISCILKAGRK